MRKIIAGRFRSWLETQEGPRPRSNWAQIASAVVSVVLMIGIYYQLTLLSRNADLAITAMSIPGRNQLYFFYRETGSKYPQLAEPDLDKLKSDPLEFVRYKRYVEDMLKAYDEFFEYFDEPSAWRIQFKRELSLHTAYLCELEEPLFYQMFSEEMRSSLVEEKKNCKKNQK